MNKNYFVTDKNNFVMDQKEFFMDQTNFVIDKNNFVMDKSKLVMKKIILSWQVWASVGRRDTVVRQELSRSFGIFRSAKCIVTSNKNN